MNDPSSATSPDRLDRIGALGGIGFTVFGLASAFSVPISPLPDDPANEILDYVVDNKTALGVSTVLFAAALLSFAGFVAMVHRRLSASGRTPIAATTWLVSGAAGVSLGVLGTLLEALLVQRIGPAGDAATTALWFQMWDLVAFTGPPLVLNLGFAVAAYVMFRDRSFPLWLSGVAAASVVTSAFGLVVDLAGDGEVPTALDFGGFLLANVWIVGISAIVLLRSRTASEAPAAAVSTRAVTA